MKPIERQLGLVAYLSHYRLGRTLEEICQDLPDYGSGDAARKKLQRDRALLEAEGLPIRVVTQEGESDDGNLRYLYQLDRRRVFSQPLRLEERERRMLFELCDTLAAERSFEFGPLAASARQKLLAELPIEGSAPEPVAAMPAPQDLGLLGQLLLALRQGKCLRVYYESISSGQAVWRVLHPLRLELVDGGWMLGAWCELRGALRNFRPYRMREIEILEQPVNEAFRMQAGPLPVGGLETRAWACGLGVPGSQGLAARVVFDAELAGLVRRRYAGLGRLSTCPAGELALEAIVLEPGRFTRWLLSWGRRARLVGGEELAADVQRRLKGLLREAGNA
jgi:predicted DNA-binding transcriptional regulator YafY